MTPASILDRVVGFTNGAFHQRGGSDTSTPAMSIRVESARVGLEPQAFAAAFPAATGEVVVFVHGLVDTELAWLRSDRAGAPTDFGSRLAADLNATSVYLRYNSGRQVPDIVVMVPTNAGSAA